MMVAQTFLAVLCSPVPAWFQGSEAVVSRSPDHDTWPGSKALPWNPPLARLCLAHTIVESRSPDPDTLAACAERYAELNKSPPAL